MRSMKLRCFFRHKNKTSKSNNFFYDEEIIGKYKVRYNLDLSCGGTFSVFLNDECLSEADIHFYKKYAKLKRLLVVNEHRRIGIGTMLVKYIISWCKKHGIIAITVHASSGVTQEDVDRKISKGLPQNNLIEFYKKCGFTEVNGDYLRAVLDYSLLQNSEDVFWSST